jgi:hypothetical protein
MHDKFRRRHQLRPASARVRHQIALEAARRLYDAVRSEADSPLEHRLDKVTTSEYYVAKRKAAAVLGHRVRPGELPSDSEVREQVLTLERSGLGAPPQRDASLEATTDDEKLEVLADHVDRFTIFKMRLVPLEAIKQNPRTHPEGDALYHSLQVFELARAARPYDEEFLLAALLHDIGKAIDPQARIAAAVESLRGTVTERTLRLIADQKDALAGRERSLNPRGSRSRDESEFLEDLKLLRELDEAGRVPGAPVGTVEEALDYLRGLEEENYLET